MKRNEFSCPTGVQITTDEEVMIRRARIQKSRGLLDNERLEEIKAYFLSKYPEPEEDEEEEDDDEDLLGDDDISIEDIKAALDEAGVKYTERNKDSTLRAKYAELQS